MKLDVKDLYDGIKDYMDKEVTLQGWIKNHRKQKEFGFIDFSDGTSFKHVQLVYDNSLEEFDEIIRKAQINIDEDTIIISGDSGITYFASGR